LRRRLQQNNLLREKGTIAPMFGLMKRADRLAETAAIAAGLFTVRRKAAKKALFSPAARDGLG
jgi:hypothetical protein